MALSRLPFCSVVLTYVCFTSESGHQLSAPLRAKNGRGDRA
jgi:hypothetical protein